MTEPTILDYPETPQRPVSDTYHGVTVEDAYRWLENPDDPAVRAWNDAQNRHTRAYLDQVPFRDQLYGRLRRLYVEASSDYFALKPRAGKLFAIKRQPPLDQPLLVLLDSPDDRDSERVVLDPNTIDPQGSTTIDFYEPSPDGRLVAVSLSRNGSEDGTLHIYDVATGAALGDLVPRVTYPTGGGSVAWNADATGLYYTRYPYPGERPPEDINFYQQVYFHALGTPADTDTYLIGVDFPRIAETNLEASKDGRYLLATVANGDGGEFAHYLRDPSGSWTQFTQFEDQVKLVLFGRDDALYLLSHKGAPNGRILRLPLTTPDLAHARVVAAERDEAIQHVADGAAYPAVLFVAGENDGRVNPAHSRKMTARLQAASGSERPVLLRTSASSGHGMGTSMNEQIVEETDVYAFLFDLLGLRYSEPSDAAGD